MPRNLDGARHDLRSGVCNHQHPEFSCLGNRRWVGSCLVARKEKMHFRTVGQRVLTVLPIRKLEPREKFIRLCQRQHTQSDKMKLACGSSHVGVWGGAHPSLLGGRPSILPPVPGEAHLKISRALVPEASRIPMSLPVTSSRLHRSWLPSQTACPFFCPPQ